MLAWDTETCPIRVAVKAPPLVVLSWSRDGHENGGLISRHDAESWALKHFGSEPMTLANAPFDLAVLGNTYPHLIPIIFEMLDADLVHDVLSRQKLYDIAQGQYSSQSKPKFYINASGATQKVFYNLSCCHERHIGKPLEKDEWRLRYAEFRDIPIAEWPIGARHYAQEDAHATFRAHQGQDAYPDAREIFADQYRQVRAHWAIHLMVAWGIRTDLEAVRKLDKKLVKEWEEVKLRLQAVGLVRSCGSKDTKLAKRLMWEELGDNCNLTDTGEKLLADYVSGGHEPREAKRAVIELKDRKYVSTNSESCIDAGTDALKDYHLYGHLVKLRGTYVDKLWRGVDLPIHSYFEPILETGRISASAPNILNPPREPGVRECFVPRTGCVYINCDFDLAELRALAQICIVQLGYSDLGTAINNGYDPHLSVAAQIMGTTYAQAKELRQNGDPHVKAMRTLAKAANFGFPGGLGAKAFVAFAKGNYGVTLTIAEASKLREDWRKSWSEMKEYHKWVGNRVEMDDAICQYKSERIRGGLTFTQAANGYFQALTADAFKETAYEISRRQYVVRSSALFGTRTVNMIHDEYLIESLRERAHEAAMELATIMREVYSRWTPDVPMGDSTCIPVLMRCWCKLGGETPIYDAGGRLIPWEDRVGGFVRRDSGLVPWV